MIVKFLDFKTKEFVFEMNCVVVPRRGENIQYHYFSEEQNKVVFSEHRVLNVNHVLMGVNHTIVCLVTDPQSWLDYEYGPKKE
jgi:hypothetical protein